MQLVGIEVPSCIFSVVGAQYPCCMSLFCLSPAQLGSFRDVLLEICSLGFEFDVAWGFVLSGLLPTGIEVPSGLFYCSCSIPLLYEGICWVLLNWFVAEIAGRDRILLSWALILVFHSGWSSFT